MGNRKSIRHLFKLSALPLAFTMFCSGFAVGLLDRRSSPVSEGKPRVQKLSPQGRYYQCEEFKNLDVGHSFNASFANLFSGMRTSDDGIRAIACEEGFIPHVYLDAAGLETIGYGYLLTDQDKKNRRFKNRTITEEEGLKLLREEVAGVERTVNENVKVNITQPQFDALVSFAYNVGNGGFSRSDLLKHLNNGDFDRAANEFRLWKYAKRPRGKACPDGRWTRHCALEGLANRRQREADLFRSGMTAEQRGVALSQAKQLQHQNL